MTHSAEMTVEQFWQYPGCNSYTREEAEEIIQQLRRFAELCYQTYRYIAADASPSASIAPAPTLSAPYAQEERNS